MDNRIDKIASGKFRYSYNLAAILVMIMHCSGNLPIRDNWSYAVSKFIASAGVIGVPWFFFMAAYFLFRFYDGDYIGLLKRKFRTLFIPYFVWNTVGYFFRILVRNPINQIDESISFEEFAKGFVPFKNANGATWFIAVLMLYVLFTPIISKFLKRKVIVYFIAVATAALIMTNASSANYASIFYYLPIYLSGGYIALYHHKKLEEYIASESMFVNECDNRNYRSFGIVFGIIIWICLIISYYRGLISQNIYSYSAPFVFILLMKIQKGMPKDNWVTRHGSFIIYASHGLFANIFGPNIYIFNRWFLSGVGQWNNVIPAYILVTVLCCGSVGIVLATIWIFRKTKWIWIFTGGRN